MSLDWLPLPLAKEIVVVGDHEQVSPYAVGFGTDKMHELIDEILVDIPNKKLYDAKSSVYDLARQSFGGTIRLIGTLSLRARHHSVQQPALLQPGDSTSTRSLG